MRHKTVVELRDKIRTVGYYQKRMKYFLRKAKLMEFLLASKSQMVNHEQVIILLLQYQKKAEWYLKRRDWESEVLLPCGIILEEGQKVIEIELTEAKYRSAVANYGKTAHDIIRNIFGVTVPDEWTKKEVDL